MIRISKTGARSGVRHSAHSSSGAEALKTAKAAKRPLAGRRGERNCLETYRDPAQRPKRGR